MALVPYATARSLVLAGCPVLPAVTLPLADALGLVTTVAVDAPGSVPPFANTAMDGYAVRAGDTTGAPVQLQVVASLAAGASPDVAVGEGEAVRIMTGAPMPLGADAVVMVERTSVADGGNSVVIEVEARPGDHVRHAGEDLDAGQEVFQAGAHLTPGHLGVLASTGRTTIEVVPRACVGVLSTGDELVDDGGPLRLGQIRDSNRPMLLGLVREAGCDAVDLGRCGDSEREIRTALVNGIAACDAVVTSGGVSVGDYDYVKVVLDDLSGGSMEWMQVAVRPAKPLAFGVVDGTPVFGLPGNPVSSMVSFELFARPALRKMMGRDAMDLDRPRVEALTEQPLSRRPDGKLHLVAVRVDRDAGGRHSVVWAGRGQSHMLWSMTRANALALVPDGDGVEVGGTVDVMLLS